ncbi:MAG: FAD-dependent oxidoreductase [Bryobacterales bacterium]|nr:FAD-dependent oxidoreductase [Bryobacterales bacterium]
MTKPRLALVVCLLSSLAAAERPGLVIVGAGISGLSAALEGARAGLQVTVVEINTVPGGHAVISSGGLLLVGTPLQAKNNIIDTPAHAERDFLAWGEDANRDWVRYYTRNSKTEIHDWMTALGTEFVGVSVNGAGSTLARFHMPRQQGIGLVLPVYREILRRGDIQFLFAHRATGLATKDGRVTGVHLEDLRGNRKFTLEAANVLISTGGFGADLDLVRLSWPKKVPLPERLLAGGGFFANGSGMNIVRDAGGAAVSLDHQWNYATGLPDPFDPTGQRGFFTVAMNAIWVNAQGKRFALEQHEPKVTIPVVAAQRPARFWSIFDSEGFKSFRIVHAGFGADRHEEVLKTLPKADSLAQLAQLAGLPADALTETVNRYNTMAAIGEDTEFHRRGPLKPIAQPPFYAAPMFVLIRKSMGGIHVDANCRVLNASGQPIPGLYASGEATGFGGINGKNGMEGAFLGPSILMGRVAAQAIAKASQSKPATAQLAALRQTPPPSNPKHAAQCAGCHDVPALIKEKRAGYWHFENSHQLVLNRKFNCLECHAEMLPFKMETHKIDRHLQINACQRCHVNLTR